MPQLLLVGKNIAVDLPVFDYVMVCLKLSTWLIFDKINSMSSW